MAENTDAFICPSSTTARAILAKDWSATALGPIADWPAELKSLLAMMLECPTPMFLAWGPDLRAFYNDAYIPILINREEGALGRPFRELWADIWHEIGPLVDLTLAGKSQRVVDMKLDLRRKGEPEESWWSFTYSPVRGDDGSIAGLFCVTGETTDRVLAEQERNRSDERLNLALSAGRSIGLWDWDVVNDLVTADARFASLYGVDPHLAATGAPVGAFFRGIHPEDLPHVREGIDRAMQSGGVFSSEYRLLSPDGQVRWVSAQGRCLHDENGRCIRFPGVSFDITDRVTAVIELRAAKDERDFILELILRHRAIEDPETIMRVSAEAIARRFGANRAGMYRPIGENRVRYLACWTDGTMEPLAGEYSSGAFGAAAEESRSSGRPLIVSDSRDPGIQGFVELAEAGIIAAISVPVLDYGIWRGGLYIDQASVRAWTTNEIALVREVAELTWLAVERAEAMIRLIDRVERQDEQLIQTSEELRAQAEGRSAAESQLHQLQKMEAVGQLTGGIAHDFNNMLAIIIGGLTLTQRRLARGDADVGKYIDGALEGAERAASLTQRLLAFSRQQPLSPEPIDCNRMISGLTELLARTLGEDIRLETIGGAGLWKIEADANQLESVIINLAVNARDAMPEGGRLTIETTNVFVDDEYAHREALETGQYVAICVTDTGTGMTPDVMARAFDPFFTTKGVGKGTGLGLSQVFGFIRQSHGHVKIYSEVGIGTTFKIYLPRYYGDLPPTPSRRPQAKSTAGSADEIILVVEDDERVRNFSVAALRELGYTVLHAPGGRRALDVLASGQKVTLLFTDVVMPEMTGRQLADAARAIDTDMKVLYTTGYARNAVVHNGVLDPGTNLLAKPFSLDQLAAKIRQVLDGA